MQINCYSQQTKQNKNRNSPDSSTILPPTHPPPPPFANNELPNIT